MAKLSDIAKRCKVAVSTVSTALNHPHLISREVRENIIAVARELGYFRQKGEIKLRKVLLIADNYQNYFFGEYYQEVIFGIQQQLSEMNAMMMILSNFDIDYSEIYDGDGIVFVGRTPTAYIEKALKYRIPFILAGHPYYENKYPCVYQDTVQGVRDLMDYVISCGHRRIALLTGEAEDNDFAWNNYMQTFQHILKQNKLSFTQTDIFQTSYHQVEQTEIAFNKIVSSPKKYSALVCSNDLIACYVLKAAEKYNVSVPADISIVGFDGIRFHRHLKDFQTELTTMTTDRVLLGRQAVNGLIKIIGLNKSYHGEIMKMVPQIRTSVRRI